MYFITPVAKLFNFILILYECILNQSTRGDFIPENKQTVFRVCIFLPSKNITPYVTQEEQILHYFKNQNHKHKKTNYIEDRHSHLTNKQTNKNLSIKQSWGKYACKCKL